MVTPSNKIKQSLKLSNIRCVSNGMGDRLTLKPLYLDNKKSWKVVHLSLAVESSPLISNPGKYSTKKVKVNTVFYISVDKTVLSKLYVGIFHSVILNITNYIAIA